MLIKRDRDERGPTDAGWLKSFHSFSFGHYMDPQYMGFGPLRVINEDRVIPGAGFSTHAHHNMEIISYVLDGELAHKDSMGNGSVIRPGDVQLMSAGSGVTHSEFNHSQENKVHFLQIWIIPNVQDNEPGYQQKSFDLEGHRNQLNLIISEDGAGASLVIKQNAKVYAGRFDEGAQITHACVSKRGYWVQIARGMMEVNGQAAHEGDGFAVTHEDSITLKALTDSEALVFEL